MATKLDVCLSHDDCPGCPYAQQSPFSEYIWYCGCGYPFLKETKNEG